MAYIAWLNCDTCATQYIEDPAYVTVWYNYDDDEQKADVKCPKCKQVTQCTINMQTLVAFRRANCNFKFFGDKFEPLTESEIDSWDIEEELDDLLV